MLAVVSALLGREQISRLHWIGAAVSALGIYFVVGHGASFGGATLQGDLRVMCSVACWVTFTLGAASLIKRHSPLYVTGMTMVYGGIPYVAMALPQILRVPWLDVSAWTLTALVLSALLALNPVSYTHLRAHETVLDLVCRLLLEKTKDNNPGGVVYSDIQYHE